MKRFIIIAVITTAAIFGLNTCLPDANCKDCYIVTYDPDGNEESRGFVDVYCDEELEYYENKDPEVDPVGVKTTYECN